MLARLGCTPRAGTRGRCGDATEGPGKGGGWRGQPCKARRRHRQHATGTALHLSATVAQQPQQRHGGTIQARPLETQQRPSGAGRETKLRRLHGGQGVLQLLEGTHSSTLGGLQALGETQTREPCNSNTYKSKSTQRSTLVGVGGQDALLESDLGCAGEKLVGRGLEKQPAGRGKRHRHAQS